MDSSCKWNHTIYGLLWLSSSLSIMFSRFIHIVAGVSNSFLFLSYFLIHFFLLPNNIPVSRSATFCCGHLGCFHLSAIMNYVVMSVCGHMCLFLLGRQLGVELLGHMVTLCSTLLGNCQNVFHSGYTVLYPHQQCMWVPIPLFLIL